MNNTNTSSVILNNVDMGQLYVRFINQWWCLHILSNMNVDLKITEESYNSVSSAKLTAFSHLFNYGKSHPAITGRLPGLHYEQQLNSDNWNEYKLIDDLLFHTMHLEQQQLKREAKGYDPFEIYTNLINRNKLILEGHLNFIKNPDYQPKTVRRNTYTNYLNSGNWKAVRLAALHRANYRCQMCNGTERLEVHHRTYERLGEERETDLLVLDRDCHSAFHANGKLKKG